MNFNSCTIESFWNFFSAVITLLLIIRHQIPLQFSIVNNRLLLYCELLLLLQLSTWLQLLCGWCQIPGCGALCNFLRQPPSGVENYLIHNSFLVSSYFESQEFCEYPCAPNARFNAEVPQSLCVLIPCFTSRGLQHVSASYPMGSKLYWSLRGTPQRSLSLQFHCLLQNL